MSTRARGFTLIELMIVIAIIGILASIAVPSYLDYVRKSKMTEVTTLAESVKVKLMEFHARNGRWPSQAEGESELGLGAPTDYDNELVSSMFISDAVNNFGRVIIDVKAGVLGDAGRVRLALTESNSMITSTYCEDSWPTDTQFRDYLPDGCN